MVEHPLDIVESQTLNPIYIILLSRIVTLYLDPLIINSDYYLNI